MMRLPKITSKAVFVMFAVSAVWLALIVTAPFMVPSNTLTDLSGRVGYHDNDLQFSSLSPVPHAIYWIGDAECHQIASRSYFLNGNEMPFCSRDVGLFIGIAAAFGLMAFYRYKMNPIFAILGIVPIGIDGGLQAVTTYESTNPVRLLTGFIAGVALALLMSHFMFVIQEDSAKSKRKSSGQAPAPKKD
jgi:uncharacterized membrane protein